MKFNFLLRVLKHVWHYRFNIASVILAINRLMCLPWLPKNKTGFYINFLSKSNTRAYFRGISFIFIYQKQNCQVENYEIFKFTNMKIDIHFYIITHFYLKTAAHSLNSGVIFMLSQVIEHFPLPHLLN